MYRRRPQRFAVQLPLRGALAAGAATLKNLSLQGAFVESAPEPEGSLVDLEFAFPGQRDRFWITARVSWVKRSTSPAARPGMGLTFLLFRAGAPRDLLHHLHYWGELCEEKILETHFPTPKTQPPGCRGMVPDAEFLFFLTEVDDREIDQALSFLND